MKIKKTANSKKVVLPILLAIGMGAAGLTLYMNTKTQEDPGLSTTEVNYVEDKDQPLTDGSPGAEDKVITPSENDESNTAPGALPEKPNVTRAEPSGDYIRVSALLTKASTGDCLAVFSKAGSTAIEKRAQIIVGPSYYACNGFRVSKSEFPVKGEWEVIVKHELNGKSSSSEPKTFIIN